LSLLLHKLLVFIRSYLKSAQF